MRGCAPTARNNSRVLSRLWGSGPCLTSSCCISRGLNRCWCLSHIHLWLCEIKNREKFVNLEQREVCEIKNRENREKFVRLRTEN